MARAKISEFRAKTILYELLNETYFGVSINAALPYKSIVEEFITHCTDTTFVVKVDQAIKKRNKLGLVLLDVSADEVMSKVEYLRGEGYTWILIEPFIVHTVSDERFIALQREVDGIHITTSREGGVNVEERPDLLVKRIVQDTGELVGDTKDDDLLRVLVEAFEENHFTYLEVNPYIITDNSMLLLDAAIEVDTAAEHFVKNRWTLEDVRNPKKEVTVEEQRVEELSAKSPSSLNLKVLNREGSVFLLLSGGGASVVVADEFSNLGHHMDIANYGEYSGNPTEEETYLYTKQVLSLLLASKAKKKVLLIAGGVANFTDISKTFNGIIRALTDDERLLLQEQPCVLVRRGGPNQEIGLNTIKRYLDSAGLHNEVHGPEVSLAQIVALAVKEL